MAESTLEPEEIFIDQIENGRVRLLCRWDIASTSRTEDNSDKTVIWTYNEAALWWTIPYVYNNMVLDNAGSIFKYVDANKTEILKFAKGSKVSIKDPATLKKAREDYRAEKGLADATVIKAEVKDTEANEEPNEMTEIK